MNRELEVSIENEEDGPLIRVSGDVDMGSSPRLLEAIRKVVKGATSVTVCMRDVRYIDSSGIAVLVQGCKLAHKQSAQFIVSHPSEQVEAVIRLSQLDKFFTLRPSKE